MENVKCRGNSLVNGILEGKEKNDTLPLGLTAVTLAGPVLGFRLWLLDSWRLITVSLSSNLFSFFVSEIIMFLEIYKSKAKNT